MDFYSLLDQRRGCLVDAPPSCSSACPLGIDVREFIRKMQDGLYTSAYKAYLKNAVLPGVVCHVCDEPCRNACVRKDLDTAVSLRQLERFCWKQNKQKKVQSFYIPPKKQKICVVGAGPCGISCAVKLAQRGYQVELVEKTNSLGGHLRTLDVSVLPKDVLEEELEKATAIKFLTVSLNTEAATLDGNYDAVLLAFPEWKSFFSGSDVPENGENGVFYCGENTRPGNKTLLAIEKGVQLSYQIEEYLKVGRVVNSESKKVSAVAPAPRKMVTQAAVPGDGLDWSKDQATEEANRCTLCECTRCYDVCPMMQYYNRDYKDLTNAILDTVETAKMDNKRGLYPTMSCLQCGACKNVCPVQIDVKELCLESRRCLHRKEQLPNAHYAYWLDDMQHAASKDASVQIPVKKTGEYAYFPGCQMGASHPDYVTASYQWLRDTLGEVGLLLDCCGAPAAWSGNRELHQEKLEQLRQRWHQMGDPTMILACPTCREMFQKYLPEIQTIFLWEVLAEHYTAQEKKNQTVTVFDPCSSSTDEKTKANIRKLVQLAGYEMEELPVEAGETLCCGYGGLVYTTKPDLVRKVWSRNACLSEREYITYCTNCKDSFASQNKPVRHIFDLLFPERVEQTCSPGLSQRRKNRSKLKVAMMKDYLNTEFQPEKHPFDEVELVIPPDVRKKMDIQLITDDAVRMVIHQAKETGACMLNRETGEYTAYARQGYLTFWVQYRVEGTQYLITNAYYHRLVIMEAKK